MSRTNEKSTISEYPVKPRRTKGTYSYRARNYFATACVLFGGLVGLAYSFLPSTDRIRHYVLENFQETEEQKVKRRRLAPFKESSDLQSASQLPVILDPADSAAIKISLQVNDPLQVRPDQ
ncbi:unnamed protein product [Chironomus riparius]|uniref:Uncharacterized protein n=1 Tax=Chironomus riparius TaxID=315576 RepID=A0A9N9WML9_9DIPT|nr:unnamed protein product [Chironomus riparius]